MNIAFFASAFHPSLGGVEEMCRQLAHAQIARGHRVGVWTERWPRNLPAVENHERIPVHRYPMRIPARGLKAKLSYALTSRYIAACIVRAVQELEIDVLHVQCVSSTTWYALHVQEKLGLPLVVTLHGELHMDAERVFQSSSIHRKIMQIALKRATAITACSRRVLQDAEEFHGQTFALRGRVIHNGVNLGEFEQAEPFQHPRPYILAIGRHVSDKGFDILLRAYARAGELGHDLVLAGEGPASDELKTLAASLKIGHKVYFTGRVEHAEAVRLFAGCSFFALPSRQEPFGIVNLEAMAAGKALVASCVGGVPEIIEDGETGLLVPVGNEQAWTQALQRLASDRVLRARLAEAGRQRVRAFGWNDVVDDYLEVYEAVTGMKR